MLILNMSITTLNINIINQHSIKYFLQLLIWQEGFSHLEYRRNICKPKGGNSCYNCIYYT